MPSINSKLASQRLNTGGSPGGLTPVSLNSGAGGTRAPQVSVGAGNVQFTDSPVPSLMPDKVLEGALNLGNTLVDSTLRLQDRRDTVLANEANLELKDALRKGFYGYADDNGQQVKGYSHSQGVDANDGYSTYTGKIKESYANIMGKLDPRVRQKALLRMSETMNHALEQGARHNTQQLEIAEKQVRYAENQDIMRSIETTGAAPWTNGEIQQHLSQYATQMERDAAAGQLATFTLYETYNQVLKQTSDPGKAYEAAERVSRDILPQLGELEEGKLDYWLQNQREAAMRDRKRVAGEIEAENRRHWNKAAPEHIAKGITDNNINTSLRGIDMLRAVNGGDTSEASDKVVTAVQEAFLSIAQGSKAGNVSGQIAEAESARNQMLSPENSQHFSPVEAAKIDQYVNYDLPKKLIDQQNRKDTSDMLRYSIELEAAAQEGKPLAEVPTPAGMLPSNKRLWREAHASAVRLQAEGLSREMLIEQEGAGTYYKGLQLDGPLKDEQINELSELVNAGKLNRGEFNKMVSSNEKMKAPGYKAPLYKQSDGYQAAKAGIKAFADMGMFTTEQEKLSKRDKKKNGEKVAEWEMQSAQGQQRALLAMDAAARKAAIDGVPFDGITWWNDYVIKNLNKGKPTSVGLWDMITGAVGSMGGNYIRETITGQGSSVMEDVK